MLLIARKRGGKMLTGREERRRQVEEMRIEEV